jgi:hypothetical protein
MREAPSLRRLWRMYKQILLERGEYNRRDLILAQTVFYTGARCIWKVLGHMAQDDRPEEIMRLIARRAREVHAIQGYAPRKRRH